jgi:hypothetical protein
MVANDDELASLGCCKSLSISTHGELFQIDCYSLTLSSYDMVLGVQWLESLGPILWDIGCHTLTFMCHGHRIQWSPDSPPAL